MCSESLGSYRLDIERTPEAVARFLRETSPELTTDLEVLKRKLETDHKQFDTLRVELKKDALVLAQGDLRETFAIQTWGKGAEGPVIDTRTETGEAISFELHFLDEDTVIFFSRTHSLGRYAWRRI